MNSRFAAVAGRIQLAITAAILVAAALAWPGAPERVPVHWNAHGVVDRWGGRVEGILALPAVVVFLSILQRVLPRLDPRRAEYSKFAGAWAGIWLGTTVVMGCVYAALLLVIHGYAVDMSRLGTFLVGGLFIVLGSFVGSNAAWTRTHRLAGWMLIASGVIVWVATVLSPPVAAYALPICAITTAIVCTIDSYVASRSSPEKVPPARSTPAE